MKKTTLFISIIIIAISCKQKELTPIVEVVNINPKFERMLEEYHKERLNFFPLEATYAGMEGYNDKFPNTLSNSYRSDLKLFYEKTLKSINDIDKSTLSSVNQTSYDVILWEANMGLEELIYRTDLLPINQFESMHLTMATLGSGSNAQPFKTRKDFENWFSRLKLYGSWLDTAQVRLAEGVNLGYTLPIALCEKMIPQFEDMCKQDVEQHLFYNPISTIGQTIPQNDSADVAHELGLIIKDVLLPRFIEITRFLKEDYLPKCRDYAGIDTIPNGKAYYQSQIKKYTTTNMNAEEIHALGLKEVAYLRSEMELVKAQVGFKGSLNKFFDHVRNKKSLMPFDSAQQVVANFNAIHERMKPNLAKLFDLVPKTPFEVRRTEAFREATASAEYMQGSLDGTRPGIFYVPVPNVKSYNMYSDEDLFLHEAIPGHHYQISLQQENDSLPAFRKQLWYSAYGEGWALYCESLGKELGLYTDPYQYFGMLSAEMHRAIRLVVDTGIHAKGWTRERAIDYSLLNEAESKESIIAEIERYMAYPGQALSYKIGQLKIKELRAKLSKQPGFDIKQFHNSILAPGCVPLAVLSSIMN